VLVYAKSLAFLRLEWNDLAEDDVSIAGICSLLKRAGPFINTLHCHKER